MEKGRRQLVQLFFDLADLIDQVITVMAVCCSGILLKLRVGLKGREMFGCKESVDFSFQELHPVCQNL